MRTTTRMAALLVLLAAPAYAQRGDRGLPTDALVEKLNGSPSELGWIYSRDGGSVNNFTTPLIDGGVGGTFDAGFGNLLMLVCSIDQFVKAGTSATTATSTSVPIAANEKYYLTLKTTQNAVAVRPQDGGTAGGCGVYRME